MNKRMKQVKILLLNSSLVKPNLHLKNLVSQILRRKRRKEECTRLKSLTSSSRALSLNIILFQTSCTTRSWSFASILDATSLSTRPGTLGIMLWDMKASSHTHDTYAVEASRKRSTWKSTYKFTEREKESNRQALRVKSYPSLYRLNHLIKMLTNKLLYKFMYSYYDFAWNKVKQGLSSQAFYQRCDKIIWLGLSKS